MLLLAAFLGRAAAHSEDLASQSRAARQRGQLDSAYTIIQRAAGLWDEVTVLRLGNDRRKQQADSLVQWHAGAHPDDRRIQLQAATHWSLTNRPERALAIYQRPRH